MNEIKQEAHYGELVWTNAKMDALRREECLCLSCRKIETCQYADTLLQMCKDGNLALAITRCPVWAPKDIDLAQSEPLEEGAVGSQGRGD